MEPTHFAAVLIWTVSLLSILCMLIRPRGIAEAYWVCSAGIILVAARLIPLRQAGHAVYEGLDVYLFLTGMMLLAELAREEGVFKWVADVAAQHAHNSRARLFVLIYISGIVVTALLSNDATAVVLTPAVLAVVRQAKVQPKSYLLACAFIANAASFVFPISNPANLVVFREHMPSLASWLRIFLFPSLASIVITFLCLRVLSRDDLSGAIGGEIKRVSLSVEGKLALAGLLIAAAALITASALGLSLGLPTCIAGVFAVSVVAWHDRHVPLKVLKGVSWSVLALVAGLFVIMEALQDAGALRLALSGLQAAIHQSGWIAKASSAFAVALLSNVMNNLPVGLIGGAAIQQAHRTGVVAHAILIGVDLGPNLSVTGSLATILWLIALRREKVEITAGEFLKFGMVVMTVALAGTLIFLWN